MADVSVRSWLPFILPDVQGCPEVSALHALRQSAVEFCEQALVWVTDYTDSLIAGEREYYAFAPSEARVHRVVSLSYNGEALRLLPSLPTDDTTGAPSAYYAVAGGVIYLDRLPTAAETDALTGIVACKPARDATYLPGFLYDDWVEPIAAGAKWRLLSTPGKRWTQPEFAAKYAQEFKAGVGHARIAMNTSHTAKSLTVRKPFFA